MSPWLFSRRTDLLVFVAPSLLSLLLVGLGFATGDAEGDTPPSLWLAAVLLVDVAHVWSTTYRVYADGDEVRRRPALYLGAPVAAYAAGVALYAAGALVFWRVLAYAAVFHFVRQQYGWMMLYRARAGEQGGAGRFIDAAAIYLATIYPLIWWHTAPPRRFHWFMADDFVTGLRPLVAQVAGVLYVVALAAYVGKALLESREQRGILWGKHLLLLSTGVCWYIGIVVFNSDYVFTVTNVLIHGIPYFALVWRYGARRFATNQGLRGAIFQVGWPAFYVTLVVAALVEEGMWDRLVWHDHPQFFGDSALDLASSVLMWVVPLLALPQAVHYILDGFIWRSGAGNPGLRERLGF